MAEHGQRPDPVAFAALTALGAIPDPMGMLNAMMEAVGFMGPVLLRLCSELSGLCARGFGLPCAC